MQGRGWTTPLRGLDFAAVAEVCRQALRIGFAGFPTWDEVVAAVREVDFLALAHRGELHAETNARRDRDAENSERRNCAHSIDEYLPWQDDKDFAEETKATAASVLRRMLKAADADSE